MNEKRMLHETWISDLIGLISGAKDLSNTVNKKNGSSTPFAGGSSSRSITQAVNDHILVFPIMAQTSISPERIGMFQKSQERYFADLMQILFNSFSVNSVRNGRDFIKQFHSNINTNGSGSIDDIAGLTNQLAGASSPKSYWAGMNGSPSSIYSHESVNEEKDVVEIEFVDECARNTFDTIMNEMKDIGVTLEPNIKLENSLMGFSIYNETAFVSEASKDDMAAGTRNDPKYTINKTDMSDPGNFMSYMRDKNGIDVVKLLDSDVKKANELQPTLIKVTLNYVNGDVDHPINFICGIKCRVIPVNPNDIVDHIVSKYKDKQLLMQLARASSKEISVTKDLIFAFKNAKQEVIKQRSNGSSPMWKVLEARTSRSFLRRAAGTQNDATMITTLIMSEELADYILKSKNIDLNKPANAKKIMDAYNFICIIIADDSTESARYLWDNGDGNYELFTYQNLEKETNGNEYRKAINLMSKTR